MITTQQRREMLECVNVSDNFGDLYCPNCHANVKVRRKTKQCQCLGCKAHLRVTRQDGLFILGNLGDTCPALLAREPVHVPTVEDLKTMGWM